MRYLTLLLALLSPLTLQAQEPVFPEQMTAAEIAALIDIAEDRPRLVWNSDDNELNLCVNDGAAITCSPVAGTSGATNGLAPGNRCVWNRTDDLPDHALPLNGQVITSADTAHPELWAVRDVSTLIAAYDDTAKTLTLKDYNGEGRFARAGVVPGAEQAHATAADDLSMASGGSHVHRIYTGNGGSVYASNGVVAMKNGDNNWQNSRSWANANVLTSEGNHAHSISSSETETRPLNFSEIWCVIARSQLGVTPTNTPTAGQTLIANGDGTATWTTP